MNIHEYQAKALLREYGAPVSDGRVVLKAEEDIRRLGGRTRLLIAGGDGMQFRVKDTTALDRHSRKLLERFL